MKRVNRISLVLLVVAAAGLAFVEPRKLPASLLAGGLLGMLNFQGLHRGLEMMLGSHRPAGKLLFLSIFRLLIVSAIIILLAIARLVNLPALAAGFTVVVAVVVAEGLRASLRESRTD